MKKFLNSFVYAYKGLLYAFKTQLNFKIHTISMMLVIMLGLYFSLSAVEWLWITIAIALPIILELVNTAIEVIVDMISPDQNKRAGAIKDLSAAAVLAASITALIIGLIIFVPKLIS